ncbi:MAG: spore germination protein [Bacillota bacterium]|nr:spore germination protein [Bacillota bacterium]
MSVQALSNSLAENIGELKSLFRECDDITYRSFTTASDTEGYIIYSYFLADSQFISQTILPNLFSLNLPSEQSFWGKAITTQLPFVPESVYTQWSDITLEILAGHTLILLEGINEGYIANTAKVEARSIEKPETETVIRGPLEAFAEEIGPNLAIIRSRFKDPKLKINTLILGQESRTTVTLIYLEGVIQTEVLEEVRRRLTSTNLRSVQESGYLMEFLSEDTWSPFPLIQSTERPDRTIAALTEGRAAILVEGSPFALLLPTVLWHFFHAPDDYFQNYLISSVIRLLRYLSYLIAISLPALYLIGTVFHPQLLPLRFLLSLTIARERVPIPTILEIITMLITLDIFREATLRLPRTIGPAIGIVGALVMGEAAVSAGIISPIMVIVVALTAVATFAIPNEDLRGTARMSSYFLVLVSSFLGLYGFLLGTSAILLHVSSLESIGVPYLSPVSNFHWKEWSDIFVRAPWSTLKRKPQRIQSELSSPRRRK